MLKSYSPSKESRATNKKGRLKLCYSRELKKLTSIAIWTEY